MLVVFSNLQSGFFFTDELIIPARSGLEGCCLLEDLVVITKETRMEFKLSKSRILVLKSGSDSKLVRTFPVSMKCL